MGWSIGYDSNWKRDIGYGVPAVCDHPKCTVGIDRGLSYVCGGEPYGGDKGCGLYFCSFHLYFKLNSKRPQLCNRCLRYKPAYKTPKLDTIEWVKWKLKDESWKEWREEQGIPETVHPSSIVVWKGKWTFLTKEGMYQFIN